MRSADGERDSRRLVAQVVGLGLLGVAALSAAIVAAAPAPYAIERPGPVFDVLGDTDVDGDSVPLIEIVDAESHATDGALLMLTINANNPDSLPSWLQVVEAYFDPSRSVIPIEALYPPSSGTDFAGQQAIQMENSKQSAIAAALAHLGYDLTPELRVADIVPGGAADGVLEPDDLVVSANGVVLDDVTMLRDLMAVNGVDRPATIVVNRGGERLSLEVTPRLSSEDPPSPVLGITVASAWDWPLDIRIQLENVGGPSAGMMFALGIVDKLTSGSLTGGEVIAGTGTIDATGAVGPIGGIRQKMYGARGAGAAWFLAPASNCGEVVGAVPDGLSVTAVATLDEAIAALEVISSGGDVSALPTCEAVVGRG